MAEAKTFYDAAMAAQEKWTTLDFQMADIPATETAELEAIAKQIEYSQN
jgi:hypothetical protein